MIAFLLCFTVSPPPPLPLLILRCSKRTNEPRVWQKPTALGEDGTRWLNHLKPTQFSIKFWIICASPTWFWDEAGTETASVYFILGSSMGFVYEARIGQKKWEQC